MEHIKYFEIPIFSQNLKLEIPGNGNPNLLYVQG